MGQNQNMESLKVAAKSPVEKVSVAITNSVRKGKDVEIVAMGAGAVNQAVKSLIKARGFLSTSGIDVQFVPGFRDLKVEDRGKGDVISAIVFRLIKT